MTDERTPRWKRFKWVIGPVLEGGVAAFGSTVIAGLLTVSIDRGVVFYLFAAHVLIAVYLGYRLQ